jgi:predicted dehydrogenase
VDLVGSPVASVFAQASNGSGDDVILTLRFEDGSIGSIVYASGGDRGLPKEYLEVLGDGRAAVLDDFRVLRLHAGGSTRRMGGALARQDKGHAAELSAFIHAVRNGGASPVDPEVAAHVTIVTFAAVESAQTGQPVHL